MDHRQSNDENWLLWFEYSKSFVLVHCRYIDHFRLRFADNLELSMDVEISIARKYSLELSKDVIFSS